MKSLLAALSALLFLSGAAANDHRGDFPYVSPLPGSSLVSRATGIIVRHREAVGAARAAALRGISIVGSVSGPHEARLVIADDGKTAVFTPYVPFAPGENVTVTIPGLRPGTGGADLFRWSFRISGVRVLPAQSPAAEWSTVPGASPVATLRRAASGPDSVPAGFPVMTVGTLQNPSPGAIFLTTTDILPGFGFYCMALDDSGHPVAYRNTGPFSNNDFKVQPNGLLSYASVTGIAGAVGIARTVEMVLDSTLAVVDSFQCGNGYTADFHEFLLLPNGHAVMMAYDPQLIDMSQVVPGGNPNAVVYGSIIQELDAGHNVVFQWRSWDYIPVTDCYDNLTASTFDYIHVNSIDVDTDGNFLVSCRETAEILKIDHLTGDIIWRWGGKHNQFTFLGENPANAPNYFSYQHDVRRIANGHITMMDNGNQHSPPYSRAAEYALDEQARTATLVWEYRHVPDVFDPAAGSVQRLPGGNTLVGWGTANFLGTGDVAVTEVRPDKSVAYEMSMPGGLFSYRAFRFPWKSGLPSASVILYDLRPGATYVFSSAGETTGVSVMFTSGDAVYNRVSVTRYPFAPQNPAFGAAAPFLAPVRAVIAQAGFGPFSADVTFDSTFTRLLPAPAQTTVYYRATEGSGTFSPLETTFDVPAGSLTVTVAAFGEFAFGWSSGNGIPTPPALIAPANGATVNQLAPVKLSWSARGRTLRFRIEIATDTVFSGPIINDSTSSTSYLLTSPLPDTAYYWRAQAAGDSSASAWTSPWKFTTRPPFITLAFPTGGETLRGDSSYVIRWLTNLEGKARLTLLDANGPVLTIADSAGNSGALLWKVPASVASGTTYRMTILSLADTSAVSISAGTFSISTPVLSAGTDPAIPRTFALEQNFPNPFNPSTEIRYALPRRSAVELEVFNTLGQRVADLVGETEDAGYHTVRFDGSRLASGVYFYRLRAEEFSETKRLLILR